MEIRSVVSGLSTYAGVTPAQGQSNQVQQNTQAQQGAQSQVTRQAELPPSRPEDRAERTDVPPRPVTNAQGQQTGTLINITA